MSKVRLHNVITHTTALGPGTRMAIWFQGCKRCCAGCMSPLSRPMDGGKEVDVQDLIEAVCEVTDIEGITISGGEPFLQIEALYELLHAVRERTELGVILYTGNTMQELRQMNNPMVDEILYTLADIIIDGEYVEALNDGGSLKGSSNQVVNYITDRYLPEQRLYQGTQRDVQVVISGEEALFVGIPDQETLKVWKDVAKKLE